MGQSRPPFVYFRPFKFKLKKRYIDVALGIRTRGHRMVGNDGFTELWRPPLFVSFTTFITSDNAIENSTC